MSKQGKLIVGKTSTIKLPTLDTLPTLPTEITSKPWFVDSINNTDLINCGGKNWKVHLLECYVDGQYQEVLVKSKVTFLERVGQRPPKQDGIGSNGEDFSETMTTTKQEIINLINDKSNSDGCFVGKSGKMYKIQNPFFREFVLSDGKYKMLTILPSGKEYIDHNGNTQVK